MIVHVLPRDSLVNLNIYTASVTRDNVSCSIVRIIEHPATLARLVDICKKKSLTRMRSMRQAILGALNDVTRLR